MVNELEILDEKDLKDYIYIIRKQKVMIDSDLARIYGYTTKRFNEQVKNNIERFDTDFMFQLTDEEVFEFSRSKKSTLNKKGRGNNIKYNPYAFTEQGIYMLMTVLKGEKAVKQSKLLIKLFKSMKDYIISDIDITQDYINYLVLNDHVNMLKHSDEIKLLKESFNKLEDKKIKNKIYFKGQYYDSYSFLLDILNSAKNEIIIIDNYTDKKILDLVCKTKNKVLIISKNMDNELIKKYCSQYNNLIIKQSEEFHDRFIIIDKKELYHLGASLKDLGKGCFGINMIDNINIINELLNEIKEE